MTNTFWTVDTTLCVRCGEPAAMFAGLMETFRQRGYAVGPEPRVTRDYPSLADGYRHVSRATSAGALDVETRWFPAGMELQGYQEAANITGTGCGRYDLSRLAKMPFLIRMRWLHLKGVAETYLQRHGLVEQPDLPPDASPLEQFNHSWKSNGF